MTERFCPHCGGDLERTAPEPELAEMVEQIHVFCREHKLYPAADNSVSESAAARILGRSKFTLRNERLGGGKRRYFRDFHGWVRYHIADLAEELLTESNSFRVY